MQISRDSDEDPRKRARLADTTQNHFNNTPLHITTRILTFCPK